jgi:hypothetical protein
MHGPMNVKWLGPYFNKKGAVRGMSDKTDMSD